MVKTKVLRIEIQETKEQTAVSLETKGLTDFEIIGLLSYYLDAYKVKMLRDQGNLKPEDNE